MPGGPSNHPIRKLRELLASALLVFLLALVGLLQGLFGAGDLLQPEGQLRVDATKLVHPLGEFSGGICPTA